MFWTIPCHDPAGRDRAMTVRTVGDLAVLGFPPPGSARVTARDAHLLAAVLAVAGAEHLPLST